MAARGGSNMKRFYVLLIALVLSFGSAVYLSVAEETGTTTGGPLIASPPRDCTYGPDTCIRGFVWRDAAPNDHICVRPEAREQARIDNSRAATRRNPNGGAYGPNTCLAGYVWRDAFPGDVVCVAPETRAQTNRDNSQANERKACR